MSQPSPRRPDADAVPGALVGGTAMTTAVLLFGLVVTDHRGPLPGDQWVQSVLRGRGLGAVEGITSLGSPTALVVGVAILAVVALRLGRPRVAACVVGPLLATSLAELVLKPGVGRRLQGVFTFPSGTVVVVAALATAAGLALPSRARWGASVAGALLTALTAATVVALHWHYATDAVAGAVWGSGVVLLLHGVLERPGVLERSGVPERPGVRGQRESIRSTAAPTSRSWARSARARSAASSG